VIVAPHVAPALLWRARRPSRVTLACSIRRGTRRGRPQTQAAPLRIVPPYPGARCGRPRPSSRGRAPDSTSSISCRPHSALGPTYTHASTGPCSSRRSSFTCGPTCFALGCAHGCCSASRTPPPPICLLGLNFFSIETFEAKETK
jgi:hypothetical protein